jgi:hypothetical protein
MKCKLRNEISERLHDDLLHGQAQFEADAFEVLLVDLRAAHPELRDEYQQIERRAIAYVTALAEQAWLIGLQMGQDITRLVCE